MQLEGIKQICDYLGISEATATRWKQQYINFPISQNGSGGRWSSDTERLDEWRRSLERPTWGDVKEMIREIVEQLVEIKIAELRADAVSKRKVKRK